METNKKKNEDEVVARKAAIHRDLEGINNKENFTVNEAASLLLTSPMAVRQAVRRGELKGLILDHRVICISREALLDWLRRS